MTMYGINFVYLKLLFQVYCRKSSPLHTLQEQFLQQAPSQFACHCRAFLHGTVNRKAAWCHNAFGNGCTFDLDTTAGSLLLESSLATGSSSEISALGTSSLSRHRPIALMMLPSCPRIAFSLPFSTLLRGLGRTYSPCSS